VGDAFRREIVARGAATGDYDGDGDPDILLVTNGGPALLYRNDGGNAGGWLRVTLEGRKSARDAYGAVVSLTAGGRTLRRTLRASSSYCSQSEKAILFGLGGAVPGNLEVLWPSGLRQSFPLSGRNRSVHIVEGQDTPVGEGLKFQDVGPTEQQTR